MRFDLPLLKNVLTHRANSFLMSLILTTAVSATNSAILKQNWIGDVSRYLKFLPFRISTASHTDNMKRTKERCHENS